MSAGTLAAWRRRAIDAMFAVYKHVVSPVLHALTGSAGACRFQPTCSEYASLAMHTHGIFKGGALAIWRLLRCNPLCKGGFDPVPGTWPPASQHNCNQTRDKSVFMQSSSSASTMEKPNPIPMTATRPPIHHHR